MIRKIPRKEKKPQPPKSFKRKIHIGKEEWSYRVSSSYVLIRPPISRKSSKTIQVGLNEWFDTTWDALERYYYKNPGGNYYSVEPSQVKDYIEKNLMELTKEEK